ncbi:cupin domain-containing protein [Alcaligenes sp. SDU_A2]|uniref:cupin domain-containing protein n=1 Tax=Alcaligenes sp. SDU_A2 TaxID=3136634 RepID=UPI00311E49E3
MRQDAITQQAPGSVVQAGNQGAAGPTHRVWPAYGEETGRRAGVWDSTHGSWDVHIAGYDEFCVIQEGEVVITDLQGTQHRLIAGDSLVMEDGFQGTWHVPHYARKYYFITPSVK